jgi:6-pyruvoyltetrahydropterin/6-carboxytetrahydropterin synthase
MTTLTRRYRFSASHRLHSPELGDAENERLYGKCNNPYGHGHNYVLEVTVAGAIDGATGLICPIGKLDSLVEQEILSRFSCRNLNEDIAQFSRMVPTTENLARVTAELLQGAWGGHWQESGVKLHRIHIQETDRNGFEVLMPHFLRPPTHA